MVLHGGTSIRALFHFSSKLLAESFGQNELLPAKLEFDGRDIAITLMYNLKYLPTD